MYPQHDSNHVAEDNGRPWTGRGQRTMCAWASLPSLLPHQQKRERILTQWDRPCHTHCYTGVATSSTSVCAKKTHPQSQGHCDLNYFTITFIQMHWLSLTSVYLSGKMGIMTMSLSGVLWGLNSFQAQKEIINDLCDYYWGMLGGGSLISVSWDKVCKKLKMSWAEQSL